MPNYPVLRCRYCGKESSRPGWITNTHEPECPRNPNRGSTAAAPAPIPNGGRVLSMTPATAPDNETPEQELERLRQRGLEYESTQRGMIKELERANAELNRVRQELHGRKGCVLCNTELLPEPVRKAVADEVVKAVSQKSDIMRMLLSSVILPSTRTETE